MYHGREASNLQELGNCTLFYYPDLILFSNRSFAVYEAMAQRRGLQLLRATVAASPPRPPLSPDPSCLAVVLRATRPSFLLTSGLLFPPTRTRWLNVVLMRPGLAHAAGDFADAGVRQGPAGLHQAAAGRIEGTESHTG